LTERFEDDDIRTAFRDRNPAWYGGVIFQPSRE
jgi:hypothetical protein